MTDYTQTFTISSDSWTDIGLGPLTVEVLTTTSLFRFVDTRRTIKSVLTKVISGTATLADVTTI